MVESNSIQNARSDCAILRDSGRREEEGGYLENNKKESRVEVTTHGGVSFAEDDLEESFKGMVTDSEYEEIKMPC